MPTLSSSATFTVGAGVVVTEAAEITILPLVSAPNGVGRLIHPTLGTYDYPIIPDAWVNIDTDVIAAPTWASLKTLSAAGSTLWQGSIEGVRCKEIWAGGGSELAATLAHLRMLLAMWTTPPDPASDVVEWYPNYTTALGFQVGIDYVRVGGDDGVLIDTTTLNTDDSPNRWVMGPIEIGYIILGRV